jgi:integrase
MPRLVYKLPTYTLHKATGQARIKFKGKCIYLGKFGSPESHQRYAEFIAQLPRPEESPIVIEALPGARLLVGEVTLRYFKHAQRYYVRGGVPTGEHVTIRSSLKPLTKRFGELPAAEFGPKKLKIVREDMINLGWSRRYVNKAVCIIRRCFTWAASEELVPGEVAMALKSVQGLQKDRTAAREKEPIGPVSDEEVDAVLPHVSPVVADVVRTMRLTGMRPGEVLVMKAEEIDRSDPSCWVYRPGHHKTAHKGAHRAVFLGAKAQEIILPRILKAEPRSALFPISRAHLRTAVARGCRRAFPHPTLSKLCPVSLTAAQTRELKTWNKAHSWHPNQLRHTVATEVRARYGLEAAQVLLGHTRADVTQTYAERDMRQAADIARKIG